MSTRRLAGVLEELKTLTPAEQRQLRDRLDALIGRPDTSITEEEFAHRLVAEGFMSAPEPCVTTADGESDWEPVPVTGEPVSQTIIDEGR